MSNELYLIRCALRDGQERLEFLLGERGSVLWNNLAFVCFQEQVEFIKILTLPQFNRFCDLEHVQKIKLEQKLIWKERGHDSGALRKDLISIILDFVENKVMQVHYKQVAKGFGYKTNRNSD